MSGYDAIVRQCADQGAALMRVSADMGVLAPLYLHHGAGFLVLQPTPDGLPLVTDEALPISLPYDRYYQWVWNRARNAPILGAA
jgi:hypothetical protein